MVKNKDTSLLSKYFNLGWLNRHYYDGKNYLQPFSADDRLHAGELLYADFLYWKKGARLAQNYNILKVDTSITLRSEICYGYKAERFRRALKRISGISLPVIYKIILDEAEIRPPKACSTRERLYFNDEIKGLLCRGLDELCRFYSLYEPEGE